MIEVRHLTKRYGNHTAVSDLSFTIENGVIYGFLGPNGAGKSTTMNIITGCLGTTEGEVLVDGHSVSEELTSSTGAAGIRMTCPAFLRPAALPLPLLRPDLRQDSLVEPDLEGDGSAVLRYAELEPAVFQALDFLRNLNVLIALDLVIVYHEAHRYRVSQFCRQLSAFHRDILLVCIVPCGLLTAYGDTGEKQALTEKKFFGWPA